MPQDVMCYYIAHQCPKTSYPVCAHGIILCQYRAPYNYLWIHGSVTLVDNTAGLYSLYIFSGVIYRNCQLIAVNTQFHTLQRGL